MSGTFEFIESLSEDEKEALKGIKSPKALAAEQATAATVGWVKEYVEQHRFHCPAIRTIRKWTMIACCLTGAALVLNIWGIAGAKTMLGEIVDAAVDKALKKAGVIHAFEKQLAPAAIAAGERTP